MANLPRLGGVFVQAEQNTAKRSTARGQKADETFEAVAVTVRHLLHDLVENHYGVAVALPEIDPPECLPPHHVSVATINGYNNETNQPSYQIQFEISQEQRRWSPEGRRPNPFYAFVSDFNVQITKKSAMIRAVLTDERDLERPNGPAQCFIEFNHGDVGALRSIIGTIEKLGQVRPALQSDLAVKCLLMKICLERFEGKSMAGYTPAN